MNVLLPLALDIARREKADLDLALRNNVDPQQGFTLNASQRRMLLLRLMEQDAHCRALAEQVKAQDSG